jgi:hypothetical protein
VLQNAVTVDDSKGTNQYHGSGPLLMYRSINMRLQCFCMQQATSYSNQHQQQQQQQQQRASSV